MNCTIAQLSPASSAFPRGLVVVVTRGRDVAMNDGDVGAARPCSTSSSSLSVRATDCDRCWSAPEVRAPPTTALATWLDDVACALAGGRGEGEGEEGKASTPPSSSSSPSSSSTFPNARGHSHAVSAELKGDSALTLDLVVSWFDRENGEQARARVTLRRESPEAGAELAARSGVVALALASARAAGAANAELAAQNKELASLAESAQASAMAAESKWRAREGELFVKFAAVLNEKKAEAAKWKQLAEARGGGGGGGVGAGGGVPAMSLTATARGEGQGGRVPGASGAHGAGGGGEAMLIDGGATAAAASVPPPAAAAAAAADDDALLDDEEDNATTEEDEDGGEDKRSDSGGSRAAGEDEGFDDDDDF